MLITFVCCAFSFAVKAQSYINNTYIEGRPLLLFSSVIADSGNFYITGVTFDSNNVNSLNRAYIAKMDNNGQITKHYTFFDYSNKDFSVFFNTVIKNAKNDFVFTGYAREGVNKLFVSQYDKNIDSVKVFEYYTPSTYLYEGTSILQQTDGSYLIAGLRTDSFQSNANVALLKLDSNFNRLWEKFYNQRKIDYARSIISLKNGNLMLGAFRNDIATGNEHANTWLLEVDTGGNIVRQWFDPNDSTYAAIGLLQTKDGGFIYGAQKKNYQSGFSLVAYKATVVKMDSNFVKQWIFMPQSPKSIYTEITDIEELPDGNFIAAGHLPYYGTDTALNGYIVKIAANGHAIWERTYRGINASQTLNFLSDIDVLLDGSLIAVGQCQNPGQVPGQVGWFLKLDSNGCEIENCIVGIDEPIPQDSERGQIQISPNPFTSYLSISLQKENLQQATFTITNLVGQTIYHREETNLAPNYTKVLDLSYLTNGMYLLEVTIDGQRTIKQIIKQ